MDSLNYHQYALHTTHQFSDIPSSFPGSLDIQDQVWESLYGKGLGGRGSSSVGMLRCWVDFLPLYIRVHLNQGQRGSIEWKRKPSALSTSSTVNFLSINSPRVNSSHANPPKVPQSPFSAHTDQSTVPLSVHAEPSNKTKGLSCLKVADVSTRRKRRKGNRNASALSSHFLNNLSVSLYVHASLSVDLSQTFCFWWLRKRWISHPSFIKLYLVWNLKPVWKLYLTYMCDDTLH